MMASESGVEDLLERVRSKRSLPPPTERTRIRKEARVSLREVAAALGVSHSLVRYWEGGGTPRAHRAEYARLLDELRSLTLNPEGGDR